MLIGDAADRRPTMKDVAALAGVGLSTVSRVVAGGAHVSAAKRHAVETAIESLGFHRDDFARTLRTGTAETIGVVVTNIADPFYARLVGAIEERVAARGSLALVASATDDPHEAERVVERLMGRRLDGIVAVLPEGADVAVLRRAMRRGTPVVFVDRPPERIGCDQVVADNIGGMVAAVRHLVAHGHRRIACFAHAVGRVTSHERIRGYREGLRASSIDAHERMVAVVDDDVAMCARAWSRMCAAGEEPTAIVTTNSRTSAAVLAALGPRVRDIAVIGFDDVPYATLLDPPLTTVAQDPESMGRAAAALLLERVAGATGEPRRIVIGTRLIARGSGEMPPFTPRG